MTPQETAAAFFKLACDSGMSEAFLALAPGIIRNERISFDEPVTLVDRRGQGSEETLPLLQAFWKMALSESMDGHSFRRGFFTPSAAHFFQTVYPDFFHLGNQAAGTFQAIVELSQVSENFPANFRSQHFRNERQTNGGDAWLADVIGQLPDTSFTTEAAEEAWAAVLKMGSEQGILAFLKKRPDAWSICDQKGRPVFKSMAKNLKVEPWSAFLESGQDPRALWGTQPIWRALLPVAPVGLANHESLRSGVEDWLSEQHQQGLLDEEGAGYLTHVMFNKIFPRTSNDHRNQKPTFQATVDCLNEIPASWVWVTPENRKHPAFMMFLGSTVKNKNSEIVPAGKRWVEAFRNNASWKEALGESGREIVQIASAILASQAEDLPSSLCKKTLENKHLPDLILTLTKLTKNPAETWLTWLKAQHLELALDASQSPKAARAPRL